MIWFLAIVWGWVLLLALGFSRRGPDPPAAEPRPRTPVLPRLTPDLPELPEGESDEDHFRRSLGMTRWEWDQAGRADRAKRKLKKLHQLDLEIDKLESPARQNPPENPPLFELSPGESIDLAVAELSTPATRLEKLKKLHHFEFQNWVINEMNAKPSERNSGDMGLDGHILKDLVREAAGIQVKQSEGVGRNVVDNFKAALDRAKYKKGYIVAFSFGEGSKREVARLKRSGDVEIELVTVEDLLSKKTEEDRITAWYRENWDEGIPNRPAEPKKDPTAPTELGKQAEAKKPGQGNL